MIAASNVSRFGRLSVPGAARCEIPGGAWWGFRRVIAMTRAFGQHDFRHGRVLASGCLDQAAV
jgi:hypothetical protein